jgi:hypothetical protein
LKTKLFAVVAIVLVAALVLPATALGYNWKKSPVSPLIPGGVKSKSAFTKLLGKKKVADAVKGVLKDDKYPSWVYSAALAQAKAGHISSDSLPRGARIGAMAFGPKTTKIEKNTVWLGTGRLPYFYVVASRVVVEDNMNVTTSYRVCLAKTCSNPFAFGSKVSTSAVSPPVNNTANLYVEKRMDSLEGTRLAGWEVTGTVNGVPVDVFTNDSAPVLVGSYQIGSTYDLTEVQQAGWDVVTGEVTGTVTGTSDIVVTLVNKQHLYNLYVEKHMDSEEGTMVGGFEVTGNVGDSPVDVETSDTCPVLVGQFTAGTPIDLSEVQQDGWQVVTGSFDTTMPTSDVTLKFVNIKLYKLYVEKRYMCLDGRLLGGWEVTGTVGCDDSAVPVDVTTTCTGPTYVGEFPAGTPIDLKEVIPKCSNWQIVSPPNGEWITCMPAEDTTLTFVNKPKCGWDWDWTWNCWKPTGGNS